MDYSKCYPIWLKFAADALSYIVANTASNEYRAIWLVLYGSLFNNYKIYDDRDVSIC